MSSKFNPFFTMQLKSYRVEDEIQRLAAFRSEANPFSRAQQFTKLSRLITEACRFIRLFGRGGGAEGS